MADDRRAVVLLSGGLDSATTLAIAVSEGFRAHALTVRYGQRHAIEVERAARLATELGAAEHRVIDLDLSFASGSALVDPTVDVPRRRGGEATEEGIPVTYVPARNTVFLALALAWAESLQAEAVFLGVNAVDYSGYPDCRPEYLEAFRRLAVLATRAGVEGDAPEIRAPLLSLTKGQIVRRAIELGVDPGLTFSCYAPTPYGQACGECDACRLRAKGFREAGLEDP
jgi:7-cyano-7-deazaguanine synthase